MNTEQKKSDKPRASQISRVNVLGVGICAFNLHEAVQVLLDSRARDEKGYVCVTGVHGVIESQRDPELKRIHNSSLLTVPDGMPTVWMGREQGFVHMERVYGPDLMLALCAATAGVDDCSVIVDKDPSAGKRAKPELQTTQPASVATDNLRTQITNGMSGSPSPNNPSTNKKCFSHFLYGATEDMLIKLKTNLEARFPGVQIIGTYAPPFRPLNEEEERELQRIVSACNPDFLWVGLSTPKQEKFMAGHSPANLGFKRDDLSARDEASDFEKLPTSKSQPPFPLECGIMLGVGAAFPIHAGLQKDAPEWIKNSGLQWLHRLCQEPRRLWRRYLDIIPRFLFLSAMQLLGIKKYSPENS